MTNKVAVDLSQTRATDNKVTPVLWVKLSRNRLFLLAAITLLGLMVSMGRHRIFGHDKVYPAYTFLFGGDFAGDLGLTGKAIRAYNPYLNDAPSVYPPFGNWIIGMTYDQIRDISLGTVLWNLTNTSFLIFFLTSIVVTGLASRDLKLSSPMRVISDIPRHLLICTVIVAASYPVIFTLGRGNHEFELVLLLFGFLIAFRRGAYGWAALWIGMAGAAKIHPLAFGLLFFYERRTIKYGFLVGIYVVFFTLFALLQFQGSMLENFEAIKKGLEYSTGVFVIGEYGTRFNSCLLNGIRLLTMWFHPLTRLQVDQLINGYRIFSPLAIAGFSILSFFRFKSLWRRVAFPVIAMILFHQNSFDYRLIHLFLPISLLMISDDESDRNAVLFTVMFGLLLIPKDYYTIVSDSSISSILNPLILLILLVMLFSLKEGRSEVSA